MIVPGDPPMRAMKHTSRLLFARDLGWAVGVLRPSQGSASEAA